MTRFTHIPAQLLRIAQRPSDRLGLALVIAALLHLALLLGLSFSPTPPPEITRTLEVTLATFQSDKAPKQADFLAQNNQQGSGTLEKKAIPRTTQVAPFEDTEINQVTPPPAQRVPPVDAPQKQKAVGTVAPARRKTEADPDRSKPQDKAQSATPDFDSPQMSSQIASLEAELAREQQAYAKRPRIYRLTAASTIRDKGAWYKEDWRKKIERVGNLNYPDQARRERIYGSLRMLVSLNRDGSLYEVQILESSGKPVLDEAAMRIVRLAAPFSPFTGDLSDIDRLEIIRTWRFEKGDRLSSN
ncbi:MULTISPECIES: energy transducer TonB [unclassified Pseudomonas]|uniref:energy transducer TonB n=1 Tax=unclassified Pseudomonas TaxID=196821 RepID=UPI000BC84FB3|nr:MULTISPECIES: energy transducer TonB [unclassified Pseudomonas]PVZ15544.1 protein TonB [Pseudomonas sp. URIL14HWK12:I12]PVZ24918.1 protein TonB [Pseudomonas sp. URIL14HWK12:I10]PVZ34764.1 protein TonB [Pseudomonas sp. URIL14HWK12:I11]SNZ09227.1 protein TonB [Pseudomonas sp. URIL14HWK12:I9]